MRMRFAAFSVKRQLATGGGLVSLGHGIGLEAWVIGVRKFSAEY